MNDILVLAVFFIVVCLLGTIIGTAFVTQTIATDCETMQMFRVGGTTYTCVKREAK